MKTNIWTFNICTLALAVTLAVTSGAAAKTPRQGNHSKSKAQPVADQIPVEEIIMEPMVITANPVEIIMMEPMIINVTRKAPQAAESQCNGGLIQTATGSVPCEMIEMEPFVINSRPVSAAVQVAKAR